MNINCYKYKVSVICVYQSNCDNTIFSLRHFSDMLCSAALAAVGTMC